MQLAAVSIGAAVIVLLASPADQRVRHAAQFQFMHGMATFACATFINVGAYRARHAPAFFLAGSLVYALPAYLPRTGLADVSAIAGGGGAALVITGWLILVFAAPAIDRDGSVPSIQRSEPDVSV